MMMCSGLVSIQNSLDRKGGGEKDLLGNFQVINCRTVDFQHSIFSLFSYGMAMKT